MSRRILFWASLPLMASPFLSGAMPAAAASASSQRTLPGIASASNNHNSILLADWDVRYRDRDWDRRDRDDYYRYRRERERAWERWHREHDGDRWHRDNDGDRWHRDYNWYHH